MPYEIKFNINLYNIMRSTRIDLARHIIMVKVGGKRKKINFLQLRSKLHAGLNRKIRLSILIQVDRIRLQKLMLNFIS